MKVHELLTDESKWTKNIFARNSSGYRTGVHDDGACCWCLTGAIQRCYPIVVRDDILAIVNNKVENAVT